MDKAAKVLKENNAEIMSIWQEEVKRKIYASKEANAIALYDHLPNIINDIADIMIRFQNIDDISQDKRYSEILKNSEQHGRHRSTTTHYTVEQVVHEYIIFHRTLSEFLNSRNGYNQRVSDLLNYIIETSILKSVGTFSRSIQEMQEKLIGTLAHDIRNPLTVAQLSIEMMEKEENKKWRDRLFTTARRSISKALHLIEGLMDGITVKAGEGIMMDFQESDVLLDLKWVMSEAKEVYSAEINFEFKEEQLHGVFDNTAIRRLLENLISNAVKYGNSDFPITVTARDYGENIEIQVHNHGNPIPHEKQNRIFEFLKRDNNEDDSIVKSWGMGLSLAQIVAKAHGGNITLKSNNDEGTLFIVVLFKNFNKPGKRRTKLTLDQEDTQK